MAVNLVFIIVLYIVLYLIIPINSTIYNISDEGVIPTLSDIDTCNNNTRLINEALTKLQSGDTLLIPSNNNYWFNGGIYASNLMDIIIQVDGSINFQNDHTEWPNEDKIKCNGGLLEVKVPECICIENSTGITFTSLNGDISTRINGDNVSLGLINGNATKNKWWGISNYLEIEEKRPRLLHIYNSTDILIENIYFRNSPYWNVLLEDVKTVEVQNSKVMAKIDENEDRRTDEDNFAFNTDGFDVAGEDIYIHDCEIFNADDCIAVKLQNGASYQSDCSRNMIFERITASGLGLTIGSIPPSNDISCVENIIFRDCMMDDTVKGIYMKSEPGSGSGIISNILYENINITNSQDIPIWVCFYFHILCQLHVISFVCNVCCALFLFFGHK